MALKLRPLEEGILSNAVVRAAGSGVPNGLKMMAARGLAPMGPGDLATALYQLSHDPDRAIASAAQSNATKVPEPILEAALRTALDAQVIDFFAARIVRNPKLVEIILLNRATHDETFEQLAKARLDERQFEILCANEQRLLRWPPIIESLYFNKAIKASAIDRIVELAVRNGLELTSIPHFEEIAANILGNNEEPNAPSDETTAQAQDALFATLLPQDEETDELRAENKSTDDADAAEDKKSSERAIAVSKLPVNQKIRLATLGSASDRRELIRDTKRSVYMAAISSPSVNEDEAARHAANRSLVDDVVRYIASRRDWQKNYTIKLALINNPKCPLAHALRILPQLRNGDQLALSRSKNIPSAVAKAAKQAVARRR